MSVQGGVGAQHRAALAMCSRCGDHVGHFGRLAFARQLDADLPGRVRLRLEVVQQQIDVAPLERLTVEQRVRQPVEVPPMLGHQPQRLGVGLVGDLALLVVA